MTSTANEDLQALLARRQELTAEHEAIVAQYNTDGTVDWERVRVMEVESRVLDTKINKAMDQLLEGIGE